MPTAVEVQILKDQEHLQERERMNKGLATIASAAGFPTLESHRSDELDFKIVSVWDMRASLEAAYNLGRASK